MAWKTNPEMFRRLHPLRIFSIYTRKNFTSTDPQTRCTTISENFVFSPLLSMNFASTFQHPLPRVTTKLVTNHTRSPSSSPRFLLSQFRPRFFSIDYLELPRIHHEYPIHQKGLWTHNGLSYNHYGQGHPPRYLSHSRWYNENWGYIDARSNQYQD